MWDQLSAKYQNNHQSTLNDTERYIIKTYLNNKIQILLHVGQVEKLKIDWNMYSSTSGTK